MKENLLSLVRNPALILTWGLPAVAVVASVLTSIVAMRGADGELPEQYHREGFQLDRDFTRAARARDFDVRATLGGFDGTGRCEVVLTMNGAPPDSLSLSVAHATLPKLDQRVALARVIVAGERVSASATPIAAAQAGGAALPAESLRPGTAASYRGDCRPADEGHWRLELMDAVNGWAVRQSVRGSLGGATLSARVTQGE